MSSPLLTVDDAASYLSVTPKYIYRLTTERRIEFVKLGNLLRFRTSDLERFIERNRVASLN